MTQMTTPELLARFYQVILNPFFYLLFAIAFLYFIWGVFQFVVKADDEGARTKGLTHIFFGILGMVVIVSARGIYAIVENTVNAIR